MATDTAINDRAVERHDAERDDVEVPMNPDCVQGKHAACAGDAWDFEADALGACSCPCHGGDPE